MSFAADLKDFAANFRDTYKTLHTSGRDELASEQAKSWRQQRELEAKADTEISAAGANAGQGTGVEHSSDPSNLRAPSMAMPGAIGEYANAIQRVESSGNPRATGPVTASGDRAYGLYQVMGKNIPAWTKAALGRAYTPEEFVADVPAQNRTFQHRFGSYVQKYGNPEDAASVWFTGLPYAEALRRGRGDQLGTRVQDYVRKFKSGLGRRVALDDVTDEEAPVVYAATGGVIPSGLGRALDTTESESAGSNPVTRDVMDAEHSSVDDDFDPSPLLDINSARQAVAGGLKFGQRLLGLETHHSAVPEAAPVNPDGVTALQTNAGAPTREEMAVVDQTIRADKVPPELRQIARMNAGYQFWIARGDKSRAEGYAWGMLSAAKRAASQYGALALSIDDPVKRAQVIAKGYNELVPDGETVKITGKGENGGARFELHDPSGKLTEKGTLAVDDMVKMATGMSNGTEYLRSMVNFATAAPSATDKRLEAERKAGEEFDATLEPEQRSDFLSTLSDEQRQKFLAQPTRLQNQKTREWQRDRKQAFDEFKFDTRMEKGAENLDRKEALDIAKFTARYGMWEKTREQVMTMHEQKLAQLQAQEAGRDNRFDQSQEARRKRQQEIDQRILDKRTAGRDGAGIKLTPKEAAEGRRTSAIEGSAAQRMQAIDDAASDETGINLTGEQQKQKTAIALGSSYDQALKADPAKAGRDRSKIFDEARTSIGQIRGFLDDNGDPVKDPKTDKPVPALDRHTHDLQALVATDIAHGNGLPASVAANMVTQAARADPGGRNIKIINRGNERLVDFGNNDRPVRMSEDGFLQLAAMMGRKGAPGSTPPASSWSNAPTPTRGAVDTGDINSPLPSKREAARRALDIEQQTQASAGRIAADRARAASAAAANREHMIRAIGPAAQGMSDAQLEQEYQALLNEAHRSGRGTLFIPTARPAVNTGLFTPPRSR